jgi:FtsP/CotA-like multicopper oxidase with cupredoxin domain
MHIPQQVNEMPGTYFWHDHAAMFRADGLQGALIVRERPGTAALNAADGESALILADWWHFPGNSLAMRLNRCAVRAGAACCLTCVVCSVLLGEGACGRQ